MDMKLLDSSMNNEFIGNYHNRCSHLSTYERPFNNDLHDGKEANAFL